MSNLRHQAKIWSATCYCDLGQVVAIQSDVAQAIARGIERSLRPDDQVCRLVKIPAGPAERRIAGSRRGLS